jgi:hypothetical protein
MVKFYVEALQATSESEYAPGEYCVPLKINELAEEKENVDKLNLI